MLNAVTHIKIDSTSDLSEWSANNWHKIRLCHVKLFVDIPVFLPEASVWSSCFCSTLILNDEPISHIVNQQETKPKVCTGRWREDQNLSACGFCQRIRAYWSVTRSNWWTSDSHFWLLFIVDWLMSRSSVRGESGCGSWVRAKIKYSNVI